MQDLGDSIVRDGWDKQEIIAMIVVPRQVLLELSVPWNFWDEGWACSHLQDSVDTLEQAKN